jgi:hypothetical protein
MENENDVQDILNPEEEVSPEETKEAEPISAEDLKKAKDYALNQKIRAEKAESELKKLKSQPVKENETPKNEMSLKDIRALNKVHDDDVDFVVGWAKTHNIEISDAVKDKDVLFVLKGHEEERKTAEAANTAKQPRGSSTVSDEAVLEKAQKGEEVDPEKLAEAKFNQKLKK